MKNRNKNGISDGNYRISVKSLISGIRHLVSVSVIWYLVSGICVHAGAFTHVGVGSRAKGMGDAFTAVADDAYALYWNPAGLVELDDNYFSFMHRDLFGLGLINYNYFGFINPDVGGGNAGFGWIRLGTTQDVEFLDYSENTYIFSYGRKLEGWLGEDSRYMIVKKLKPVIDRMSIGTGLKYYYVDYGEGKSTGYGADLALRYSRSRIRLGLVFSDIVASQLRWDTGENENIENNLRAGIAYCAGGFSASVDVDEITRNYRKVHVGTEKLILRKILALRAGIFSPSVNIWNLTCGFGFNIKNFIIDYAYEYHPELGNNHLYSMSVRF
ncbi:MAG: hypothetical protein JXJ19_01635 [Elusimicrobia bacterium]|nr:hypothetical protein [Elusimicrobiota bacterium]